MLDVYIYQLCLQRSASLNSIDICALSKHLYKKKTIVVIPKGERERRNFDPEGGWREYSVHPFESIIQCPQDKG